MLISDNNTKKLQISELQGKIPPETVGIDIGQSLTKFAYLSENELQLKVMQTSNDYSKIIEFIENNKELYERVNFTGGKAYTLYKQYSNELKTSLISEFDANIKGIEFLHECVKNRDMPPSLVVTLGTGTSIVLKTDCINHLGGSAMGGGFFMGLIRLLFKETISDFLEAINLAKEGNRYQVDLKVGDIYNIEDTRVDKLFREFTAATLGKINETIDLNTTKKEDIIISLISTIGENIGTIATLMAENHEVKHIFFCGGFLIENKPIKQVLSLICKIKGIKPIFLDNSVYAGAIGSLIFNKNH
ncbi:MAG: hypothetical protein ACFE96_02905 [Candidatus Hermodarchaeota archaeon]